MNGVRTFQTNWLPTIGKYLAVIGPGNLVWEFVHMPLYTLWQSGTVSEIVFAGVHCTGGDILIATISLVLAVLINGPTVWPQGRFLQVAATAVFLGLSYTVFSEWLNIEIRRSWAYSDLMPTLPWLGTGVSPLAQWVIMPGLGFWLIRRRALRPSQNAKVLE